MMVLLLCIFSEGKELNLSKCVLTTALGWPNLRSSVLSASLYNNQQYANSAIAVLNFPVGYGDKILGLVLLLRGRWMN